MNVQINSTTFGSIIIDDRNYNFDVLITADDQIHKRKKKLSKKIYGTSHKVSREEVKDFYQAGVKRIIIGTGQFGVLKVSKEAKEFLNSKKCHLKICRTPKAIKVWNETLEPAIGLFHITC